MENKKYEIKYHPAKKIELKELINDENICLGEIDVSKITNMSGLFDGNKRKDFTGIESWDVSNLNILS